LLWCVVFFFGFLRCASGLQLLVSVLRDRSGLLGASEIGAHAIFERVLPSMTAADCYHQPVGYAALRDLGSFTSFFFCSVRLLVSLFRLSFVSVHLFRVLE
jgi:hypothetical protein